MGAMFWFWAAACLALLIVEVATAMLVSIWFVGGAAAALIVYLCGGALWLQIVLFFAVSVAMLSRVVLGEASSRTAFPHALRDSIVSAAKVRDTNFFMLFSSFYMFPIFIPPSRG